MDTTSRILIVDDSPSSQTALASALVENHYQLAFASTGFECLALAGELKPDLILLDVMMPGMDGFEVCRQLRANPTLADVPIMMITALDDRASLLQGIEAGADDFITKPFERLVLQARVRTVTRLNRYRKLRERLEELQKTNAELHRTQDAIIEGLVQALDLRDKETEGHTLRVTQGTLALARRLGIGDAELVHIRRGALMHDIGKLGIPDAILHKRGALSPEEWQIMRQHPQYAYDWLSNIPFLQPALDIPYCHHEKWDGAGYPRGLKGEQIPLSARCFAIVDVWDALCSERPYKAAWPESQALAYLREQTGHHFDPRLIPLYIDSR